MERTVNPPASPPVSCLVVTQPGREALLADSLACLGRQRYPQIELVLVHDGGDSFDAAVRELAGRVPVANRRVVRAEGGLPLGALRNIAVDSAVGELVCQWDDDDLYHPDFLPSMATLLAAERADFCMLTGQLHYYRPRRLLFWEDYDALPAPRSLIEGTLFGFRARMPRYPGLGLGEDTSVLERLLARGDRVVGLRDMAWLRMYSWHGGNAWDFRHHADITRSQRRDGAFLEPRSELLQRALAGYPLGDAPLSFPHGQGAVDFFRAADGGWKGRRRQRSQ